MYVMLQRKLVSINIKCDFDMIGANRTCGFYSIHKSKILVWTRCPLDRELK